MPKISKYFPVMTWSEAFKDFLHRAVRIRMILLAHVARESAMP